MTVQECYEKLGGNYGQIKRLLGSDGVIKHFIVRFLSDKSYVDLCRGIHGGQCADAFRAVHTLKGTSATLGFTALASSAGRLAELLRKAESMPENAGLLLEDVSRDYDITVAAINSYLESGGASEI